MPALVCPIGPALDATHRPAFEPAKCSAIDSALRAAQLSAEHSTVESA